MKLTKEYLKKLDEEIELIPLSYDRAFKSTFKTNLNLLKHILNVTLPIEISKEDKINLLDSEMPIINKKEHEQIVDIFVVINISQTRKSTSQSPGRYTLGHIHITCSQINSRQ